MDNNSNNFNSIIAIILGVVIFFVFISPMLNDKPNRDVSKVSVQTPTPTPTPTNVIPVVAPTGTAPVVVTPQLIAPSLATKEAFKHLHASLATKEEFKPLQGHHASHNVTGTMGYNELYYPVNLETVDSNMINNEVVALNNEYNHQNHDQQNVNQLSENNMPKQEVVETFIANVNDPYNGDPTLTKFDQLTCSHQCCKHVQWPVPFDPVALDSKNLTEAETANVIGSNLSCNLGSGSGCLCVTQGNYDTLVSRSGNAINL